MSEVPQHVRAAAIAAFRTHQPGRVLLQRVDPDGVASTAHDRSPVFAGDDVCVHVDVARDEGRSRITVRLEPDLHAVVELQHPDLTLSFVTSGRSPLRLEAAPQGLARLLITSGAGAGNQQRWQTAWTRL